jgi:hypothetical protein
LFIDHQFSNDLPFNQKDPSRMTGRHIIYVGFAGKEKSDFCLWQKSLFSFPANPTLQPPSTVILEGPFWLLRYKVRKEEKFIIGN